MGGSYRISEKSGKSFVLYFQLFLSFIPYRSRKTHTHTQNQITFVVFFFFVIFQRDQNISQRNSGADSDRETHRATTRATNGQRTTTKNQSEKKGQKNIFFFFFFFFFLMLEKKTSHFSLFAWGRWFIDLNKKKKKKRRIHPLQQLYSPNVRAVQILPVKSSHSLLQSYIRRWRFAIGSHTDRERVSDDSSRWICTRAPSDCICNSLPGIFIQWQFIRPTLPAKSQKKKSSYFAAAPTGDG